MFQIKIPWRRKTKRPTLPERNPWDRELSRASRSQRDPEQHRTQKCSTAVITKIKKSKSCWDNLSQPPSTSAFTKKANKNNKCWQGHGETVTSDRLWDHKGNSLSVSEHQIWIRMQWFHSGTCLREMKTRVHIKLTHTRQSTHHNRIKAPHHWCLSRDYWIKTICVVIHNILSVKNLKNRWNL